MTQTNLVFTLALQNVEHIGDITAKKLIRHCGCAENVFKESRNTLLKIDCIGTKLIKDLHNSCHIAAAESEIQFLQDHKIEAHYFEDSDYPERLKHCIDGPILLFSKGNINIQNQPMISIVGTRKITTKGVFFCESLIEQLKPYNPIIVSGFAYGTDIVAQKAASANNLQTIGCLAHGFDQMYPKIHQKYVERIEAHGGFYTDFWSTSPFKRTNFLKRNRIIAGLSEATIVIESASKGGSLVTADIAISYNREVFAVPGRTTDEHSKGCNDLIKFHRAHMLTQAEDIPYILNWKLESEKGPEQQKLFVDLNPEEIIICDVLRDESKMLLDIIALRSEMPTYKVASLLLNLELKGVVRPLPGKQFELI
mgnify:CR=1 FL=1